MTKVQDEDTLKLKPYQIILLSCLLGSILVLNSNYVNKNRDLAKLNKEKEELFDNIIQTRRLSGKNYSEEVCSKGSDDLIEYYKTGDLSKIDLDEDSIECEDKDKDYMKTLISIMRSITDDKEDDDHNDVSNEGDDRLRNLGVDSIPQDDLISYGMRLLAMIVFLAFGLLSFIGWIVCCFCCCCNCCCCCCCKKKTCKIPCFVFTYIFYALVIGVCFYGLTQTNKIFVGIANTECSFLKFLDEVIDGEMKQELPRWAGVTSIKELLTDINSTITAMSTDSYEKLNSSVANISDYRENFINKMQTVGDEFYDGTNYKAPYIETFHPVDSTLDYPKEGDYVYDMVYNFGRYDSTSQTYTPQSLLYLWNEEFRFVADEAFRYLTKARSDFTDILNDNLEPIQGALSDGTEKLDELLKPFNDINEDAGELLYDISDYIDHYGKMGVNIVFGTLMSMNVCLAVLMLMICLFSQEKCAGCCCCRCLFKFCTHILWNVLALLMALAFLIGSILALVGRIGGDMMSLLSYVMSVENFNGTSPLLVGELGDAKDYVYRCIHGDGDIAKELKLGDSLDSFESIKDVESNLETVKNNFTTIIQSLPVYNKIIEQLDKQSNYTAEITMIPKEGTDSPKFPILYSKILDSINQLDSVTDKWDNSTDNSLTCSDSLPSGQFYHPKNCKPSGKLSTYSGNHLFEGYAEVTRQMDSIVDYASKTVDKPSPDAKSFRNVVNGLQSEYITYLSLYSNVLDFFITTIQRITSLILRYTGSGNAFSFLNGKFIGRNIQIILKYLKHSLGGDLYTVGICLCIIGCSLILSISSTILLIVIINVELKEIMNKQKTQTLQGGPGMVVEYQSNYPVQMQKY